MATPQILAIQATTTGPVPKGVEIGTDLLLAPEGAMYRLRHFPEGVYRLTAESHLVRFAKVLLGDAGAGQLRKRLMLTRLQQNIQGTHFYDLDRFYGALFGMQRTEVERLSVDPYNGTATGDVWDKEQAKDSSYRSRLYQFARGLQFGATATGIELVAEAVLSIDCDVYESWVDADISPSYDRRLFTVRPKRVITLEESYNLRRVLRAIKPADARFVIDYRGTEIHTPMPLRAAVADSEYWEVVPTVKTLAFPQSNPYQAPTTDPAEQPKPAFSSYQGEAWSYNGDLAGVAASYRGPDDTNPWVTPIQRIYFADGTYIDYGADKAVLPQRYALAGRAVSDGVLVSAPYSGPRQSVTTPYIDAQGQVWSVDYRTQSTLSPIYADRIPLDSLVDALGQSEVDPVKENPEQRYWVTPTRDQDDETVETFEVRLSNPKLINYLSYEVAHYPQSIWVEVFTGAGWIPVADAVVSDSIPSYLPPGITADQVGGHPEHSWPNHWIKLSTAIEPILTQRIRWRIQRAPGVPPMQPMQVYRANSYAPPSPLPYSLAIRFVDVGYRVYSKADLPADPTQPIATATDILGSLIEYRTRTYPANGCIASFPATPTLWKSEPQPISDAVVCLYLDGRDSVGGPQVIDRFFMDPTHSGVHLTIYYSNDNPADLAGSGVDPSMAEWSPEDYDYGQEFNDGMEEYPYTEGYFMGTPGATNPVPSDFTSMVWTPIALDFVTQKGFVNIPPTAARFWKFEFTNLAAEPYENFVPITRTVQVFPGSVRDTTMVEGSGQALEALPAGVAASTALNGQRRFTDTPVPVTDLVTQDPNAHGPTVGYFARDPAAMQRLKGQSSTLGFQPWHQGISAPRWPIAQVHVYQQIEVQHSSKASFFVGLNSLQAYRVDYTADDDTQVYTDLLWDFLNIQPGFTWTFDPNKMSTLALPSGSVQAVSKVFHSKSDVVALQFATHQSDPIQLAPDDQFQDPALATSTWDDTDVWHAAGDGVLSYSPSDHSVIVTRTTAAILRSIGFPADLVQPPDHPVFDFRDTTVEDTTATAAEFGGVESGIIPLSTRGRVYAAARVTALSPITSPLFVQITAADDTVLVEKAVPLANGEMVEWWVPYDIGTMADGGTVRVRVVQKGKSNDQFKVQRLSLFDDGIIWEFSNDGGSTWHMALGIRNNENGILTFPTPGNQLMWRLTGVQPYVSVSALRMRPWYRGIQNARLSGTHRGPNVSTWDHEPPIEDDPWFTTWTKPIPRSWFYAAKQFPILPAEGAPNVTAYSRYYGRPVFDTVPVPTDVATRYAFHPRPVVETVPAPTDVADRHGTYSRSVSETVPAPTDTATSTVTPSGKTDIVAPPVHPPE